MQGRHAAVGVLHDMGGVKHGRASKVVTVRVVERLNLVGRWPARPGSHLMGGALQAELPIDPLAYLTLVLGAPAVTHGALSLQLALHHGGIDRPRIGGRNLLHKRYVNGRRLSRRPQAPGALALIRDSPPLRVVAQPHLLGPHCVLGNQLTIHQVWHSSFSAVDQHRHAATAIRRDQVRQAGAGGLPVQVLHEDLP